MGEREEEEGENMVDDELQAVGDERNPAHTSLSTEERGGGEEEEEGV